MNKYRKYTQINCSDCAAIIEVRSDHIKNHRGLCKSCSRKKIWQTIEYRQKSVIAHTGHKHTEEVKQKMSESHKNIMPKNIKELHKKHTLEKGEASFNFYYNYQRETNARKRGIEFSLTKEQVKEIVTQNCYYCGSEPSMSVKPHKSVNGAFIHNGIDRVESSIGYVAGNCVPCCKKCNYAKHVMSTNEFVEWITKIYENFARSKTELSK